MLPSLSINNALRNISFQNMTISKQQINCHQRSTQKKKIKQKQHRSGNSAIFSKSTPKPENVSTTFTASGRVGKAVGP
jgi:hypothetical protein